VRGAPRVSHPPQAAPSSNTCRRGGRKARGTDQATLRSHRRRAASARGPSTLWAGPGCPLRVATRRRRGSGREALGTQAAARSRAIGRTPASPSPMRTSLVCALRSRPRRSRGSLSPRRPHVAMSTIRPPRVPTASLLMAPTPSAGDRRPLSRNAAGSGAASRRAHPHLKQGVTSRAELSAWHYLPAGVTCRQC